MIFCAAVLWEHIHRARLCLRQIWGDRHSWGGFYDHADADHDDAADADYGDAVEIPVAVLMRADNHRPCRERWQAKTLKISPSGRAPSSCSENKIVTVIITNRHHCHPCWSHRPCQERCNDFEDFSFRSNSNTILFMSSSWHCQYHHRRSHHPCWEIALTSRDFEDFSLSSLILFCNRFRLDS